MELEAKLPVKVVTGIICAAAQEKFNSFTVNWHYYITVLLQNPYQKKKKKEKLKISDLLLILYVDTGIGYVHLKC